MHWVPGRKEIEGNELADQQAKQAAIEMSGSDVNVPPVWDKREAFQEMKNTTVENGIKDSHVQKMSCSFMRCFLRFWIWIVTSQGLSAYRRRERAGNGY